MLIIKVPRKCCLQCGICSLDGVFLLPRQHSSKMLLTKEQRVRMASDEILEGTNSLTITEAH